MAEINLLLQYPRVKRDLNARAEEKTEAIRTIARRFGREFFDGDRKYGYGGFSYNPKYWEKVVPDFQKHYHLQRGMRILDVGCAKGFMLHDFSRLIPGLIISGIDISSYAIRHALPDVRPFLRVADAKKLPFPDKSFDLVIAVNTIHNLPLQQCKQAVREIERVSRKHAFITVDAYRNDTEKERMFMWNLTAKTILSVSEWKKLFSEVGYTGDYYWFTP
jgi:ubiquinone/menaquinone biosynthesis C-methylase UbiE